MKEIEFFKGNGGIVGNNVWIISSGKKMLRIIGCLVFISLRGI